ncbi:LANO_0H13740g1_1 [Lachancea nothofagi CBS 11611]|uniref:LANO_0H13740g1_1 n=1 Tax=Lachancea nothofagi CBS 11611 TaxID=1266666 RepID=A0A1G4KMJ3_9SACH|nr:LANO_0H13740g1_1 [Lachancea nothofagi CBS 11611]
MTIKTIYIARHGYRSNWLPKGPYPPPPTGVNSDVPLAEHGVKQAKELAHYIMSIENQPEMIFSSPFYRCLETSQPISDLLEVPIQVERGIGEWYKPDREVIPEPASFAVLNNFFPGKLNMDWQPTVIPSKNGETEEDIFNRCREFWPKFVAKLESQYPNIETILLVTHAATKIALGMNLLGFDNCRDPIDGDGTILRSGSCSLDKYELIVSDDATEELQHIPFWSKRWRLTMNGNTEFLSKGEEMHWDFQYGFEAGSDADIKARQALAEKEALDTPDSNAASLSDGSRPVADSDAYEHVYFSVDIPADNAKTKSEIEPNATMQYSGLETEAPLIKVGNKLYEGQWQKLVGTEMVLPDAAVVNKKAKEKEDEQETENEDTDEIQEQEPLEDSNSRSEKIYRITDRLVMENVHPM